MSDELYSELDDVKRVHFDQDEKEERTVDIYVSAGSLTVYDNPWVEEISPPNIPAPSVTSVTVSSEKRNPFRAAAVSLGLLCLLLLAGIIGLGVKSIEDKTSWSEERNQLWVHNANLTEERNQLQSEKDRLEATNGQLIQERDELLEKLCKEICGSSSWQRLDYSCYSFFKSKKTWRQSKQHCEKNNAQLVIISSRQEQEFVISRVLPTDPNTKAWIGLTRQVKVWTWLDGTPLTTDQYWHNPQPEDDSTSQRKTEDCAVIAKSRIEPLHQEDCMERKTWICEKTIQ
ncbi:CD209 antigen-like protein E [Centroberyx affinis]|uniref:CD209 antigen-like protein E n=1 Tax=Centroberyx affinis TaxID=166261 RepID=UPI003A5C24B6